MELNNTEKQEPSPTESALDHLRSIFDNFTVQPLPATALSNGGEMALDPKLDQTYLTHIGNVHKKLEELKVTLTRDIANYLRWVKEIMLDSHTIFVPVDTKTNSGKNLLSLHKEIEARVGEWPQKPGPTAKLREYMRMAWLYKLSNMEIISLLTMAFDFNPGKAQYSVYNFLWDLKLHIGSRTIEF